MTQSINELINDEAVYRTAPATPGLLITRLFVEQPLASPGSANDGEVMFKIRLLKPTQTPIKCQKFYTLRISGKKNLPKSAYILLKLIS